jgi:peptidylprolyl isomerase
MAEPENTLYLDVANAKGEPKGRVIIELRPDLAPNHVARIKELAREGAYDGVVFHRVIEGFMAQTGDPTGTGMGGSKLPNLKAEFSTEPHVRGICSMARSQNPDSANSQFFICFDDARFLDRQYRAPDMVVAAAGAVEHEAVVAEVERRFGRFGTDPAATRPSMVMPPSGPPAQEEHEEAQTALAGATVGPKK